MKVEEIPIEDIIIPENRVRATFTEEQYQELKASIEKHGFKIPILVRQLENGKYELIDGEHRIQVVKELGWDKIPAVITDADDYKATMLNILANTARGSQNPMDVAEALRRAYDAGATVKELAAATGHTEDWVRTYLTLTELEDWVKEALREGKLKVGHIEEAMRLDDPREVYAALKTAMDLGWNVKTLKYYVENRLAELEKYAEAGKDGFVEAPPTPQYAQELVQYGDCMICKRKVNRSDLFMPVMCVDCRTFIEWLVEQIGTGKEAMQTVYNALNLYFNMMKQQQNPGNIQQLQQQQTQNPGTANTNNISNEVSKDIDVSEEDIKIIKLIKKLKKEGIL